jgi:hypothetical protein
MLTWSYFKYGHAAGATLKAKYTIGPSLHLNPRLCTLPAPHPQCKVCRRTFFDHQSGRKIFPLFQGLRTNPKTPTFAKLFSESVYAVLMVVSLVLLVFLVLLSTLNVAATPRLRPRAGAARPQMRPRARPGAARPQVLTDPNSCFSPFYNESSGRWSKRTQNLKKMGRPILCNLSSTTTNSSASFEITDAKGSVLMVRSLDEEDFGKSYVVKHQTVNDRTKKMEQQYQIIEWLSRFNQSKHATAQPHPQKHSLSNGRPPTT